MKKIANIITKNKKADFGILFNVTDKKDNIITNAPTLVISNALTKELYPDYDIIDWKINDNTYWTFGLRERRQQYESDVEKFKELAVSSVKKKIKYTFVNLFLLSKKELASFFKNVLEESGYIYLYNNICYYYVGGEEVKGFSLIDLVYLGHDVKKFISLLYKNEKCKVFTTKDIDLQVRLPFQDAVYAIPYLLG